MYDQKIGLVKLGPFSKKKYAQALSGANVLLFETNFEIPLALMLSINFGIVSRVSSKILEFKGSVEGSSIRRESREVCQMPRPDKYSSLIHMVIAWRL